MPDVFDDSEFQAKSDARTLAEAKVIQGDKGRLQSAEQAAVVLAEEAAKDAKAMQSVSKEKLRQQFDHPTSKRLFNDSTA